MEEIVMKKAWDSFCQNLTDKKVDLNSITPKNTRKHYDQVRNDEIRTMAAYQRAKNYYIR